MESDAHQRATALVQRWQTRAWLGDGHGRVQIHYLDRDKLIEMIAEALSRATEPASDQQS